MPLSFLEVATDTQRQSLEPFLAKHSNAFDDLSVWASALSGPPMRAWAAINDSEIVAVASLCSISSVDNRVFWSVKGRSTDAERALFEHLVGTGVLAGGVTVCPEHLVPVYEQHGTLVYRKLVSQMGMPIADWLPIRRHEEVYRPAIHELSAFYRKWQNKNWDEAQFYRGPHVAIRRDGTLVAAFGTQAVFPGVVHIGNAFIDPAYRGQGLLKHCLTGLLSAIAQEHPAAMVSLYIGDEAAFTISTYERVGMTLHHRLTELEWIVHDSPGGSVGH